MGFITALVICFKQTWAPMLAPVYALAEGLFLGGISASCEAQYPGIVIQAVGGTFGTLAALLLCYQSGLIRATENFKLGIVAATGGIFFVYLISMIGGMFGFPIPFIHEAGPLGIGFSVVVVIIAALNLVLDFDFIETAAKRGAPKYLEWYGAFAYRFTQCNRRRIPLPYLLKQLSYRREYLSSICNGSITFKKDIRLNLLFLPLLAVHELLGPTYKHWGMCPLPESQIIGKTVIPLIHQLNLL